MRVKIDGVDVIDRVGFAELLRVQAHSGFDKRRQREAGFPDEYARLHGHPYWRRDEAEAYAHGWRDRRLRPSDSEQLDEAAAS